MKQKAAGLCALILTLSIAFSGCADTSAAEPLPTENDSSAVDSLVGGEDENTVTAMNISGVITEYDYKAKDTNADWSAADSTAITLNGDSAVINGGGATAEGSVITISEAGTYVLTGTLSDGQIRIEATSADDVRLVLNGVTISSSTSAAVYSVLADKTVIILADETVNNVSDGAEYVYNDNEDEPNAAIFAKDKLAITGSGTLNVTGNFNNGIGTKDDLVITGGTINITAVNDGVRGRDAVAINSGDITISAGGDGIKSNNDTDGAKGYIVIDGGSFDITAGGDAIQAETSLTVAGGSFEIETGGGSAEAPERQGGKSNGGAWMTMPEDMQPPEGFTFPDGMTPPENGSMSEAFEFPEDMQPPEGFEQWESDDSDMDDTETVSMKGLKGGAYVVIAGGTFEIDTYDDGVHSNGSIVITGGTLLIQSGDDGIHADAGVTIDGGTVDIRKCYEGIEGTTVDLNGGAISVVAADDGINASDGSGMTTAANGMNGRGGMFVANESCYIRVTGGEIKISSGADGFDSNGHLYIDGGSIEVHSDAEGPEDALDADGTVIINGGTVTTAGGTGVYHAPSSDGTQNTIVTVFSEKQTAGAVVSLRDSDEKTVLEITAQRDFTMITLSSAELEADKTYGLYLNGEKLCDVTISKTVTEIKSDGSEYSGGGMGFGGAGGERPEGGFGGERPEGGNATGARPEGGGRTPPQQPAAAGAVSAAAKTA